LALMNKARAMTMGKGAFDHVKSRIRLGASNDPLNRNGWRTPEGRYSIADESVVSICVGRMRQDWLTSSADPATSPLQRLLSRADMAAKAGCGNCGEQASLAFAWLMRYRATPVEYMTISNGDHAFCVLNRDKRTDVTNPDQWNEASVYIDPWRSLISFGRDMARRNRGDWFGRGSVKYHFTAELRLD